MAQLKHVDIPASHGRLEGLLRLPDDEAARPRLVAVVCHPHPLFGGTMHNKTVFRLATALNAVGIPTLRFNFRGVGLSTGSYDEGRGEQDDIRAALDELERRFPGVALCVAGFSFGAWTGLRVGCAEARVQQLVGVGVPVASLPVDDLANCAKPKLIVQGARDQYGPEAKLRAWFAGIPDPKHLEVIPEADHFLTDHLAELERAVVDYFKPE
ncbi:MAG TPA: alpha/beta family hydrolase [Ktedonobacterales bacterium]|nr:alpha/beta family hydrolase [Ktedonobacterales bacterium]